MQNSEHLQDKAQKIKPFVASNSEPGNIFYNPQKFTEHLARATHYLMVQRIIKQLRFFCFQRVYIIVYNLVRKN